MLLIGVFVIFLFLFCRKLIVQKLALVGTLQLEREKHRWLRSYWQTGIVLFGINALLFSLTFLILFGLRFVMIPYIHLFVMIGAVSVSILVWLVFARSWHGSSSDRWKVSLIGSSFYFFAIHHF
ncbi:hypothetical protein SH601_11490 [Gracilibacillus sp. S3-1-1]|uniref:Uncharacterized protein n=1 Tax=Gracilibacillus pellucidus TaxID=3095368 RepID=A0ACC6M6J8_9BACI|nr:hypothetical protein [Gracilibacillus sp. S3-1-1]MDX8046605.1 hypothetical protein [Gracilibacillus sp. S3-1-1]